MNNIFLSHNNIYSNLGQGSLRAIASVRNKKTTLQKFDGNEILPQPYWASVINDSILDQDFQDAFPETETNYTKLEKMMLLALAPVITASGLALDKRVGLIIATTKGNIDALDDQNPFSESRAYLSELGKQIQEFFGFYDVPWIISNACVSGILAVATAERLVSMGTYDHIFIVSGDLVSRFTLSGFQSFQALSSDPCKPYDTNRSGINIGELAASALVTSDPTTTCPEAICILGSASCNDANHISGPSRTGEGLYRAMLSALQSAKLEPENIDFISAHGTATVFNDEMEAIAFNRAGLQEVPVHSMKGFFGHTLGASGLLEAIIGMHSVHQDTLFASLGYETLGVSQSIKVISDTQPKTLRTFLKTASGFGGCNTAIVFEKRET